MEDDKDNKMVSNILLVIIAVTIIFILFTSYYGLKNANGNYCQNEKVSYTQYLNANSTFVLNSTSKYILQKFSIEETDYKDILFCYNVEIDSDTGAEINIIDAELNVLGVQYVNNQTTKYCSMIDSEDFKRDIYLGLICTNCDSDKQLYINYDSSGEDTQQVRFNTNKEVVLGDPLGFEIIFKKSCKSVIKWLFEWYIFIVVALLSLILLLVGLNKFKEILFNDME